MIRKTLVLAALLLMPAAAQGQQPTDTVLSGYLRRSFAAVSKDLSAVVTMMPELGFKPVGAVKDVRTFGEISAHLVAVNAWVCSMGDGKGAAPAVDSTHAVDKTKLLAVLDEVTTRCTAYFSTLTDRALADVLTSGAAPRQLQAVRGNAAIFAIAHSNEHYGNLVTYIRAKGLVPPTTPSQAGFLSPVKQPGT